jgi:hypothetical protein
MHWLYLQLNYSDKLFLPGDYKKRLLSSLYEAARFFHLFLYDPLDPGKRAFVFTRNDEYPSFFLDRRKFFFMSLNVSKAFFEKRSLASFNNYYLGFSPKFSTKPNSLVDTHSGEDIPDDALNEDGELGVMDENPQRL